MQRQGYNRTAVILHWILAVSIFFLFVSSWWMLGLPLPSKELTFREFPFQLHKNIGITLVFFWPCCCTYVSSIGQHRKIFLP